MLAVIIFLIILGVLIFVHELGHFLTARRNGIKAEEFGFGFPPRIAGVYKNEESGKYEWVPFNKRVKSKNTIYSLNWIPLGGFVKIKGEDGHGKIEEDSFAGKSAWVRIKVLAAGVTMNFVLAWVLISIVYMLGAPQAIEPTTGGNPDSKIQISAMVSESPAEVSGIKIGDEISKVQKNNGKKVELKDIKAVQEYIAENKGKEIVLSVVRGDEKLDIKVVPRSEFPEGEGALGVALSETVIISYPWYQAIWEGLKTTLWMIWAIILALGGIIRSLFMGQGVGADVAGPIGIAVLTRDVANLGLVYILNFAAILSINLGIINILPIPALDGGRIVFVLVEKIKGRPVSQKVEQAFHSIGFMLLILLLVLVTFKDVFRYLR
jgi:regulator of sigma E protease